MVSQDISMSTNRSVLIGSIVVCSVFLILRSGARWYKTRQLPFAAEDIFMYVALASFAVMCGLYLAVVPTFYNIELVAVGLMEPYPDLEAQTIALLKEFLAVQLFFWLTLWAVKWSLLCMFQKLTSGLQTYTRIWWGVMTFSILAFIGCVISQFTSCSSIHAWLSIEGLCNTPRDAVAKRASLYYSLVTDILSDLMIMAIPLQVLYNLRINTAEKISVGLIFGVSFITMACALVRVISLDSSTSNGEVNTTWLILWAVIEGGVSIIVGCLPSFAIFIRGRVAGSRDPYYDNSNSDNPNKPNSHSHSSRAKHRARVESLMLDEVEPEQSRISSDGRSNKSLVDGEIIITQGWSQRWHHGNGSDVERERARKLGLGSNV